MAKKELSKDDDFSYAELIEYEEIVGEPFQEVDNEKKPRLKKIAVLGWLRAKREVPGLKFGTYIEETDAEQIFRDAVGGDETEEVKKETNSEKPVRKPKQDSA